MTRNTDHLLITQNDPTKNDTFRLRLAYLEVVIPRLEVIAEEQIKFEKIWKQRPIEMIFNRLQVRQFTIPAGSLTFTTDSLFLGEQIVNILQSFFLSLTPFLLASHIFCFRAVTGQGKRKF